MVDSGDLEKSFGRDDLLTNIMLYWVTQTIGSSMLNYYAEAQSPSLTPADRVSVPVGLALFPRTSRDSTAQLRGTHAERAAMDRDAARQATSPALEEPELLLARRRRVLPDAEGRVKVESFKVEIPQPVLDDLRARLDATRPVPWVDASDWDAGTSPAYLGDLVEYWRTRFDWRAQEAGINRFAHFRASLGSTSLHFIHERGRGESPLPLVLLHGYPDSFLRFVKLIPLLTDPAAHGGDPRDAFDVVVPTCRASRSPEPLDKAGTFHVGDLLHRLMTEALGYGKFGAHGGDWGSTFTEHLARSHASSVVGIHLTDIPFWHSFQKPGDLSAAEEKFLAAIEQFQMREGAYAMIQGTRPQTLADGLNDSPAGLAAWLVEKFQRWSDCGGDVETRSRRTSCSPTSRPIGRRRR
jgi:pimeloyl-ACP methyl ester carboxylesterase